MLREPVIPPACLLRSATQTLSQGASGGQMLRVNRLWQQKEPFLKSFLSRLLGFLQIVVSLCHCCREIAVCSELGENLKQMNPNILDWKVVFKPKCFMRVEGGREAETQGKYWGFLACKVKLLCKETMNPDSHLAGKLFQGLKIFQNILTCFWRAWNETKSSFCNKEAFSDNKIDK